MDLRNRGPALFRAILATPLLMLGYLVASGRWAAAANLARLDRAPSGGSDEAFLTSLLWLVSLAPLFVTAWSIGREHVGARRHGYDVLIGLREVVRRAFGRQLPDAVAAEFAQPPRDNPRVALGIGIIVAVLLPVFFASVLPDLRSGRRLAWLGIAGVIMGSLSYARHRAMAYLHDEPGRWDMFRQYRLLNPARYEEAGRGFVRWQIVGSIVLAVWWLGGGALLVFAP